MKAKTKAILYLKKLQSESKKIIKEAHKLGY